MVLVAIDIAKLLHDVLIEAPGWNRKRFILTNNAVEFRRFAEFLHSLKHPARVVFEATGNYIDWWLTFFRGKVSIWN